jgi:protein-disulfide isomerase
VCAGEQAKFWEMDSWLFMHAPGAMNVDYAPAAQALGLDLDALHACMERDDTYARADADYEEAVGNDIRATPGYMIDGQAYPPEAIMDAIDDRL